MNILIINHYAGSPDMGMEFRPYYFAKEWTAMGHKVSIISANFSHLRRKNPAVTKNFQKDSVDNIDYYWIKTGQYESNGLKRAITIFQFVFKLWTHPQKIVNEIKPDIVICSSTCPIDTFVGQKIRKKSTKKVLLVHEIHDMWPLTPIELGGMSPRNPFIKIMQWGEDSFCKNADVIVSLLPNAKDYLVAHGMEKHKYNVITNGVVLEEWNNPVHLDEKLIRHFHEIKKKNLLSICFCGSIHKSAALECLIDAIASKTGVALTLIGPGLDKKELQKKAAAYKDRIFFFDAIPKKSIPSIFQYIDIFFVGSQNYSLNRFGMCMNKVFDAMMGGKPILYAVNAPNNYIDEFECGVTVNPENKESIIMGIQKLEEMSEDERILMGQRGRMAAMEHFDYRELAKKFLQICSK